MHKDFIAYANIRKNEYLLKTEELFTKNKSIWLSEFNRHFREICKCVQMLQTRSELSALSYLEYTMLNANFINKRYIAYIMAYNDKSYLDRYQRLIGTYDVSFMLVYFNMLWDDLINTKRRYAGLVSAQDVTTIMLQTLPDFFSYLINIARFAIMEECDSTSLGGICKNKVFEVKVGGYMVPSETVYSETKDKNAYELIEWFHEQLDREYIFGDYSDLDFSGESFEGTDFRYARFQNSVLKNTSFRDSSIIGVNFCNADMERSLFENSSIYEANFSDTILKNAYFNNARGKAGLADKENWEFAGFLPVRFCNANLDGADFSQANLAGADFSHANLSGTNFSGAILNNANFTKAILTDTMFDGADLADALWN
jgi:uncharacterized protein YjbI with pentapeptide repeats